MRKIFGLVGALALLLPTVVLAQARKTSINCTADSSGNVTVNFLIKGVGNGNLCVISSGTFTANCACETNGGNCPNAANKRSVQTPATGSQIVEARNGQIRGSNILSAPNQSTCTSGLSCPSGQNSTLVSVQEPEQVSTCVFAPGDYTNSGSTCTANPGAQPVVPCGTCSPTPQTIPFSNSSDCLNLFQ